VLQRLSQDTELLEGSFTELPRRQINAPLACLLAEHTLHEHSSNVGIAPTFRAHRCQLPGLQCAGRPFAMCISARALVVTPAASGSVTCHDHLAANA
jgi:hypothetical protein